MLNNVPPSYVSLSQIIESLLMNLRNEREMNVLKQRYKLDSQETQSLKRKATLQSIGNKEGITRERVRQIENAGVKNMIRIPYYNEGMQSITNYIIGVLESHGGVMAEHHLVHKALCHIEDRIEQERERRYLFFILNKLIEKKIVMRKENELHEKIWAKGEDRISFLKNALVSMHSLFESMKKPLVIEDLFELLRGKEPFVKNADIMNLQNLENILIASRDMKKSPFGEWGLKQWADVLPKKIGDKIYLVLKKHCTPLHYKKIAEYIDIYQFDNKKAHPPTIHNELILDDRYVLVGRGTYALKEWGFKEGVISHILTDILQSSASGEMSKEEIMEEIRKQRQVKESTVYLALNDKSKFKKTPYGTYGLASHTVVTAR